MLKQGAVYNQRYQIKDHVKTGSTSEIYTARDHLTGQDVIIKCITAEPFVSTQSTNAIFIAAKKMTHIVSPNIVHVVDCCSIDGYPCVVSQKIEGITLTTYCEKKEKLNFKESLSIAIQCCMGLQELLKHDVLTGRHFYHSYISSKDIIISTEGKVMINNMFMPMIPNGTSSSKNVWCYYSYPKTIHLPGNIEKDLVYSLGIILIQMLTGEVPFKGNGSIDSIFLEHKEKSVPSVNIPCLEEIIAKCCNKSPKNRFDTVQELVTELKKALVINSDSTRKRSASINSDMNIQAGIKRAIEYLGMEVLLSKKMLINAIEDLQPNMIEEREFLYKTYNNELGNLLYRAYSNSGNGNFEDVYNYLINMCGFNVNWSNRFTSIFEFLISEDYRDLARQKAFFTNEMQRVLRDAMLDDNNRLYVVSEELPTAVRKLINFHEAKNLNDGRQVLMALTVEKHSDIQEGIVVLFNKIVHISKNSLETIELDKIYDVKALNQNGESFIKVHQTDNRIIETSISSRYYNISPIINYLLKSKKWR